MNQMGIASPLINLGSQNTQTQKGGNTYSMSTSNVYASQNQFSQKLSKAKEVSDKDKVNRSDKKADRSLKSSADANKDKVIDKGKVKEKVKDSIKVDNSKSIGKEEEILPKEEVTLEEYEEIINSIEDQMLQLICEALNIPLEEVTSQLEQMNLSVQDLLSEENFGTFINQMVSEGDVNALLTGEVDIQQMSTLFAELQELGTQMPIKPEIPLAHEFIKEEAQEKIAVNPVQDEIPVEMNVPDEQHEMLVSQFDESVQLDDFRKERYHSLETLTDELADVGSFVEHTSQTSELGMTIPIHNFTTTTFTQNFQDQSGVMTQTTIMKQVVNGKTFIEQVDFKVLGQIKELNVALSPKELGNMNIKIVEQHGTMIAEIKVDNEKAKEFILNEIGELKDSLEEQGLNVADVKVDIRQDNHEAQMQQERQKSSKRIQEILASFEEEDEEEQIESQISSESEVDYMV